MLTAGENAGGTYIDMRNLGTQRTLVLVNGKRLGISTSGYQDISTLPVSAVERIEVLKDGASAIYGSDAMAGVVNIITRSNVTGVTANVYHGQYSQGDGARDRFDVVAGWSNDRLSLTLSAEHAEEKGVWARDRGFSKYGMTDRHPYDSSNWTTISQYGQFTGLRGPGCTATAGCGYSLNRGADPTNPANYHLTDSTPFTGDVSNANDQMHVMYPVKRDSVYFDGRFKITDNVNFRTELGYNQRESTRQIAGYPLQSSTAGVGSMSINSYFNPFGRQHGYATPTAVAWNRRTWEVPRVTTSELKTYRAVASFDGSFEIGSRYFDWEVGYQYNRNELESVATGNLHKARVAGGVGPSFYNAATGKVQCGTAAAPISYDVCKPWNPLVPYGTTAADGLYGNEELQAWLFPEEITKGRTTSKNFFANIAGSIVTLPAGDLGFAFGVESRKEEGKYTPDALAQTGATTNLAAGPTGGDYTVNEAYLEVNVPVLADLPGAKELTFNGATRFGLQHLRQHAQQQVRLQVEADRLADGAWHLGRGLPCTDHQRPVRWWFGDLRAVQRSVRHPLRFLGLQRGSPCTLRTRHRQCEYLPPAAPGRHPGEHVDGRDPGAVHLRVEPAADAGNLDQQDAGPGLEPELHPGLQRLAGLVEDPHRQHDHRRHADPDPAGLLRVGYPSAARASSVTR